MHKKIFRVSFADNSFHFVLVSWTFVYISLLLWIHFIEEQLDLPQNLSFCTKHRKFDKEFILIV